jgi:phosphatidylinositol glycan class C protein
MNAATSASVVLASRLADDLSVFALVLCAIEVFALYPMLRRMLQVSRALYDCRREA